MPKPNERFIKCHICSDTGLIGMIHPYDKARYTHRCECGQCGNAKIPTVEIGLINGYVPDWQYNLQFKTQESEKGCLID